MKELQEVDGRVVFAWEPKDTYVTVEPTGDGMADVVVKWGDDGEVIGRRSAWLDSIGLWVAVIEAVGVAKSFSRGEDT